jgi:hypothetical protein
MDCNQSHLIKDRTESDLQNGTNHPGRHTLLSKSGTSSQQRFKYGINIKMGNHKRSKYQTKTFKALTRYNDSVNSKEA